MKHPLGIAAFLVASLRALAIDNPGITAEEMPPDGFALIRDGRPCCAIVDETGEAAVRIAAHNLADDFRRVTGAVVPTCADSAIVVRISPELHGLRELYRITFEGSDLVISASDRRGAVYGLYELSEQIGVSPWYDWLDAPVETHESLYIVRGEYTNGEPAVRYRGIFLNDEVPCLTSWVKNTYGTDTGDHRFYQRLGELILRLRGNFLWPAMWCWAFYADDPANSKALSDMGIIVGTSHHEPMARNHKEWARLHGALGDWNYSTNSRALDRFFADGVRRAKDTEDLFTIGMRGDGDVAMAADADIALLGRIIRRQREIIECETGRAASDVPQVWAIYKEVQEYYDKGLRVPDDVTILLCDDNWGDVRRLPDAAERSRPGGWGMYYHFDYVGAPRNAKFFNVTSAIHLWEQMALAYEYGVDRLWVANVGDLKMQEYPTALFLDMAWNPAKYTPATLHGFTLSLCERLFGRAEAAQAARILDDTSRRACRISPELLDAASFDLASGEWLREREGSAKLLAEAKAQYTRIPKAAQPCYFELVLFHASVMANLYDMYYAQAMNAATAAACANDPNAAAEVNAWADSVDAAFRRHAELCKAYNSMLDGKWNGFANQPLIGYTSWSDGFGRDKCPATVRIGCGQDATPRLAWLAESEPPIDGVARTQSHDAELGEDWWMRRHNAVKTNAAAGCEYDLVMIGDSITHRWERHGAAAYAAVTNSLRVLNLGFGADNVQNCLWRLRNGELDGYSAKAVQILIGTNNPPNEPPDATAAQIRAILREVAKRQPGAKILLCPILPRGEPDSVERGRNDCVNALLQPLCDGKKIIWADWCSLFLLPDGRIDAALSDDALHPNAAGYAKWKDAALPVWIVASQSHATLPGNSSAGGSPASPTQPIPTNPNSSQPIPKIPQCKFHNSTIPQFHNSSLLANIVEAVDYTSATAPCGFRWETLPGLGPGKGAVEVFPRTEAPAGASICYDIAIPAGAKSVEVTVVTRSTLPFARRAGHRYAVGFEGGEKLVVNFNSRLNEEPANIYAVYYPTVARRIVEKKVVLAAPPTGTAKLVLSPLDQGIAFERIYVENAEH